MINLIYYLFINSLNQGYILYKSPCPNKSGNCLPTSNSESMKIRVPPQYPPPFK